MRPRNDQAARDFVRTNDVPCPACGYNLRGNTSGLCPECGAPYDAGRLAHVGPDVPLLELLTGSVGSAVCGSLTLAALAAHLATDLARREPRGGVLIGGGALAMLILWSGWRALLGEDGPQGRSGAGVLWGTIGSAVSKLRGAERWVPAATWGLLGALAAGLLVRWVL